MAYQAEMYISLTNKFCENVRDVCFHEVPTAFLLYFIHKIKIKNDMLNDDLAMLNIIEYEFLRLYKVYGSSTLRN